MAVRLSTRARDRLRAQAESALAFHGPLNNVKLDELEDVMVECLDGQMTIGDMVAVYLYRRSIRHG